MTTSTLSEDQQKKRALDAIISAWEAALADGVDPDLLASTAIFAALADMVDLHGEDAVAAMCQTLADRVRAGEFTLARS